MFSTPDDKLQLLCYVWISIELTWKIKAASWQNDHNFYSDDVIIVKFRQILWKIILFAIY